MYFFILLQSGPKECHADTGVTEPIPPPYTEDLKGQLLLSLTEDRVVVVVVVVVKGPVSCCCQGTSCCCCC